VRWRVGVYWATAIIDLAFGLHGSQSCSVDGLGAGGGGLCLKDVGVVAAVALGEGRCRPQV
jgi:hypothetical protein